MKYIDINEMIEELNTRHPDKMLLDDIDSFNRGKLAGHIEIIEEIRDMLSEDIEEIEEDDRY